MSKKEAQLQEFSNAFIQQPFEKKSDEFGQKMWIIGRQYTFAK